MIKLTTKEDIVSMLLTEISINKYDLNFLHDLHYNISNPNYQLTTNQTNLIDRLIHKYRKQLLSKDIPYETIIALPWKHSVIQSEAKVTSAYITIIDDIITLISPYSRAFLTDLRSDDLSNEFIWNKKERRFEAKYYPDSLRTLVYLTTKHFPVVNYCPITSRIVLATREYEHCYWEPTLVKTNGNLIIAALNESLDNATKNITLNTDIKTLALLAEYGIEINHSVTNNDPKLEFAGNFMPYIDLYNADKLLEWLLLLGCDCIYMLGYTHASSSTIKDDLYAKLMGAGIKVRFFTDKTPFSEEYKYPIILQFISTTLLYEYSRSGIPNIKKIVTVLDSSPVNIK